MIVTVEQFRMFSKGSAQTVLLPSASVDPSGVNRLRSSAVSSLTMMDVTCACKNPFLAAHFLLLTIPLEGLLNVLKADAQMHVYVETTHHTEIQPSVAHLPVVLHGKAGAT